MNIESTQVQGLRILTDHGTPQYFSPYRKAILLKSRVWEWPLFRYRGFRLIRELIWGLKCWIQSISCKDIAPIITSGQGHSFIFAFMQYICMLFIRPRTHIMFDFLLDRKRRGVIGLFEKIKMHVLNRVVDLCIIWGQTDIETFAKEYNLPKSKLLFHPFHITLEKYQFDIFDGGYIFAGGNGGRDYKTLIEALKQIELPVFIATTLPNISSLATSYKHITVRGITPDEFREKMAGCTIFVECHDIDFFRTAGHQTILNAMWMGKPVVLADRKSAKGYITDGTDGLVVDAGDIEALRSKIIALLNDISLARKIGENAQKKARRPEYRTLNNQQSIYNIAIRRHCKRLNLSAEDRLIEMY